MPVRIPFAEPAPGTRAAKILERAPVNIMRLLAHSEEAMAAFSGMGAAILSKSTLDPALRELAILRVGHVLGAVYETTHHERIGRRVGMSEAQIAGARAGAGAPGLSEDDALVIAFAEEFNAGAVSAATFARAAKRFSHAELIDLAIASGFYGLVSRFLNSFGLDEIEDTPDSLGR
ncbi:MAG: carboxymuconolactone decarboxylase family protein [Hyphomonadaceae bacterium]